MKKEYFFVVLVFLSVLMLPALVLGYSETFVSFLSPGSDELVGGVVDFLKFNADLSEEFTSDMKSHFHDVRLVMVFGWLLVFSTVAGLFYARVDYNKVFWQSGVSICGFLVFLTSWILIDFDSLFTVFHLLLFPQGNWQFPSDSIIISLFPQEFFITTAIICVVFSFLIGVGLVVYSLFCNN